MNFFALLSFLAPAFAINVASLSTALFDYVTPNMPPVHYGPGGMDYTNDTILFGSWRISTTDTVTVANNFFVPITLTRARAGSYFHIDSLTLEGYLDLDAGTSVRVVQVELLSDLPEFPNTSNGAAMTKMGSANIIPAEGADGAGYVGAFSAVSGVDLYSDVAASDISTMCSNEEVGPYILNIKVVVKMQGANGAVGTLKGMDAAPFGLKVGLKWTDCSAYWVKEMDRRHSREWVL